MPLTLAEANLRLAGVTTPEELRALISLLDISANGTSTVFYSGDVPGGGKAQDVARGAARHRRSGA